MTARSPRLVMALAALVLAGVLAAFAVALLTAQGAERDDARERFVQRASIAQALTESIFATSVNQSAQRAQERYGGTRIDPRQLQRQIEDSNGSTSRLLVTDDEGTVLGDSGGDPAIAARLANIPPVVQVQKESATYMLSDVLDGALGKGRDGLVFALGFDSPQGRRATISVFGEGVLSIFFGGYLARIPGSDTTDSYVVDSQGRVIGTPVRDQRPGDPLDDRALAGALEREEGDYGDDRFFTSAPIDNSTWRVVLATSEADLYAGISSTVEWLILAALAIAGLFALGALYRTTQSAAELQRAYAHVEATNADLARTNLELTRSNAELEQFASVASHDLQEPLRKVQTFGDQLERRFGDSIPDEGLDYLRRMRRAAGRMSVLIEDLLQFSRVTTRAQPPERVDLTRIAHEVISDLETTIAEAHAVVEVSDIGHVEADPSQMRQLLQNLIANAIKFARPGVVPEVQVGAVPSEPGTVAFAVSDNGIGIEPEYHERIFRVFERLHPRDVFEGTGIGLALCRKIAERHGGTIVADSEPGVGSTFTVTLPIDRSEEVIGAGLDHTTDEIRIREELSVPA